MMECIIIISNWTDEAIFLLLEDSIQSNEIKFLTGKDHGVKSQAIEIYKYGYTTSLLNRKSLLNVQCRGRSEATKSNEIAIMNNFVYCTKN